jgi:hypothetical protein
MPHVLKGFGSKTAIFLSRGRKKSKLIELRKGQLVIHSLTDAEIAARGYEPIVYDVKQAAQVYMKHGGGISDNVRLELARIIFG